MSKVTARPVQKSPVALYRIAENHLDMANANTYNYYGSQYDGLYRVVPVARGSVHTFSPRLYSVSSIILNSNTNTFPQWLGQPPCSVRVTIEPPVDTGLWPRSGYGITARAEPVFQVVADQYAQDEDVSNAYLIGFTITDPGRGYSTLTPAVRIDYGDNSGYYYVHGNQGNEANRITINMFPTGLQMNGGQRVIVGDRIMARWVRWERPAQPVPYWRNGMIVDSFDNSGFITLTGGFPQNPLGDTPYYPGPMADGYQQACAWGNPDNLNLSGDPLATGKPNIFSFYKYDPEPVYVYADPTYPLAPGEYVAVEETIRKTVNPRVQGLPGGMNPLSVRVAWPLSPIQREFTQPYISIGF